MIDFSLSNETSELLERIRVFVAEEVMPVEATVEDLTDLLGCWHLVEEVRAAARDRGLYLPQMPAEYGGLGLGMVEMALIQQECGASALAPLALNAMAPDEGNMHTLLQAGNEAQKERWLRPLAAGEIRSCFAMTEPDVASSDPLNLQTSARRDGAEWVLEGRKWFATGAIGAELAIVVARTGDPALGHRAYSLFLVPCDTPGWRIIRDPGLIGAHFPGGHPEVELRDVRLPAEALLGGEGEGFAIAQHRLAGGRLAHAMRWIGIAQKALDLSAARLPRREAFGKPLAEQQALQFFLADSAIDLYASRMMVLNAAWKVERGLPNRQEIAMVKTFVSEALGRILDRAVQVFGSHGIATDDPIGGWYADARAARIYDGASEVHRMVIARTLLRHASDGESTRDGCGYLA